MTVIATLYALAAERRTSNGEVVEQAIKDLEVDPEKAYPQLV